MINDECSLLSTLLLAHTENMKSSPHPCCKEGKGYGTGPIKDLGMEKTWFGNAYY